METLDPKLLEASFRRCLKRQPVQFALEMLHRKGWTQAQVAKVLGVSASHLCHVLNGRRKSRRILHAIDHLPDNPKPA